MYDYLKGFLTDKRKTAKGTFFTVETFDTGYLLEVSEKDFISCTINDNEKRKFYISLIHREDTMSLYGFLNKETRDIFQILLSVSGVGAKMALALLNEFDDCDLISFVIDGNFKELTRAKGVGPKLAQKIILELKDKLIKPDNPVHSTTLPESNILSDVQSVMESLGYNPDEIKSAIDNSVKESDIHSNTEEILRKALMYLSV